MNKFRKSLYNEVELTDLKQKSNIGGGKNRFHNTIAKNKPPQNRQGSIYFFVTDEELKNSNQNSIEVNNFEDHVLETSLVQNSQSSSYSINEDGLPEPGFRSLNSFKNEVIVFTPDSDLEND